MEDNISLTITECLKLIAIFAVFLILFIIGTIFTGGILQIFFAFSGASTFTIILILLHDAIKYGEKNNQNPKQE